MLSTLVQMALITAGALGASPVDARVSLVPPEIPFHKQATYTVVVDSPRNIEVQLPDMSKNFGKLEVYGPPDRQARDLPDGRRRTTVTYTLEGVLPAEYPIKPVEVTWGKGERLVVPSPLLRIRELTPVEEAQVSEFQPIIEPREPGPPVWRKWAIWAGGVAVLAVALALAVLLRRRKGLPIIPERHLLPWEAAYLRLDALRDSGTLASGDYDAYYVELSSILREYIEKRFGIKAPEQTTPEFLAEALRIGQFSVEHQRLLAGVLRHSDRVKFAKYEPASADMENHYAEVRRFIDETVPRSEPSANGEAAA